MVYICILMWNNSIDTIACIRSLQQLDFKNKRIVLIDNNSDKPYLDEVKNDLNNTHTTFFDVFVENGVFSNADNSMPIDDNSVIILNNDRNAGYGSGNNIGINYSLAFADCEFIWILNNDTLLEHNALSEIVGYCKKNDDIAICGSKLIYYPSDNEVQGVAGKYHKWTVSTSHIKEVAPAILGTKAATFDYVIGASMLIKRHVFDKIETFDPKFFLYFEELDLCMRARNAGFNIGTCEASIVYHKESATIGDQRSYFSTFHFYRSLNIFLKKHYPFFVPVMYIKMVLFILNSLRKKRYKQASQLFSVMKTVGTKD